MTVFQVIVVPLLMALAASTLIRAMRGVAPRGPGFLWAGVWTVAASCVAFPAVTGILANWLGIGRGADLVLYATALAGLATALYFYRRYRHLEGMMTGVIRREAMRSARRGGVHDNSGTQPVETPLGGHAAKIVGVGSEACADSGDCERRGIGPNLFLIYRAFASLMYPSTGRHHFDGVGSPAGTTTRPMIPPEGFSERIKRPRQLSVRLT
jgi:hypothetical protein